ncbi:aminobenzoyl-glutamate utilization protein A [Natronorubrum sediminis]|uniref:Aminobenzoyl-glutamate utilization protein A n=1 Tax=Natronorubrum sediminis TaxID=640943 RepID=A0A1H6G001_9EURY|nr:amidohydrolase [Natronorubrum sediminis]SEH15910.1 aminobenzoyl-glutamate utilization protein A [Natronorubrum sediminis]
MTEPIRDRLVSLRRSLHRHPEPAWREFTTTAQLVEEIQSIGVDELAVGPDAYDPADRMAVPEGDLEPWIEGARERGADPALLESMAGGNTGAIAVLERGVGPTIGLRVDIDGLFIEESTSEDHEPAAEGFRSEIDGTMHACGHDVHMTWGLAVLEAIAESGDFSGRLVVFFQPAEEVSGGGCPMAKSEFADDLDYLLAVHVGLDHPTGEVVAGIEKPLAMCHVDATIHGTSAHAGKEPNEGDNAMHAMGTAIGNAYGIPRHRDGMTRVNVGYAEAGSASNVIAERAHMEAEARGETTELMEYMKDRLERAVESAATMHGCRADVEVVSESPRADSDPELQALLSEVATDVPGTESVVPAADFGASEDATFLMERVQREGGLATYLIVGTDHPTNHHTPTFDVDEASLAHGVDVLVETIRELERRHPVPQVDETEGGRERNEPEGNERNGNERNRSEREDER